MADKLKSYLKIEEVADATGCSKRHIMEEIKRGNLKAYKPGKCLIFNAIDVESWVKRKLVS